MSQTTTGTGTGTDNVYPNYDQTYISPNMGWICPKCNRSNAPWKGQCNCDDYYDVTTYPPITYPDRWEEYRYPQEYWRD